jgi:alcohol dehydrogenase (NADP+)
MHWPIAFRHELLYPETAADCVPLSKVPLIDTWKAMEPLVDQGLCRNLGVANFSLTKLKALITNAKHKPQVLQVEMHPYLAQPELVSFCREQEIVITAYAPLGSAGRPEHLKASDEPVLLKDPIIAQIAAEHGATPAQVLLHWGIARGTVVIPKSVNPKRIAENFGALLLKLSSSALSKIDQLNRNRRYFDGGFWNFPEAGYTTQTLWD